MVPDIFAFLFIRKASDIIKRFKINIIISAEFDILLVHAGYDRRQHLRKHASGIKCGEIRLIQGMEKCRTAVPASWNFSWFRREAKLLSSWYGYL